MVLKNVPAFYYGTSPNKFFDYAAAGIPIINNYPGWLAGLITENQAGLAVPPDDPIAFADSLQQLAEDRGMCERYGANARRLAEARFSRDRLAGNFVEALEQVARE
ncbi:MAG: glycosyltransferase, partial [Verrucomicrobia bacterium]|nr:glycosyltransferase [Verrucomicrobiota bacterium]